MKLHLCNHCKKLIPCKCEKSKSNSNLSKVFLILFSLLFISIVTAITITQIQPSGDIVTSNDSVSIEYNISTDYLNNLTWSWDGTNYSIYDDSLVLFMNFDNRSALGECFTNETGCVKDLSKYGNNGTLVGNWNASGDVVSNNISWTNNGKYGGAFNFSGNTSYIQLNSNPISVNNNFTVGLWIKWNQLGNNQVVLGSAVNTNDRFRIGFGSDTDFRATIGSSGASYDDVSTGTGYMSTNQWYSVIVSWSNSTGVLNMYINNIKQTGNSGVPSSSSTAGTIIGALNSKTSSFINATLDDFIIYNKSLSENEISQLYNFQLTKYNSSNWNFQTNQTIDGYGMNYNLCSSNSTTEICSSTQNIRGLNTITTNFISSIGIINNNFYGTGESGESGFSSFDNISLDNDCIKESQANYQNTRNAFLNGGFNVLRLDIEIQDLSLSEGVLTNSNTLNSLQENVRWAYQNNKTIVLNLNKMPNWLANQTSGLCNISNQVNSNYSCMPTNLTKYSNVQELIINNLTNNGEYISSVIIEIWNEAWSSTFLNNLTSDNNTKGYYYNLIYNNSWINLKESFPTLKIIPTHMNSISSPNIANSFYSNFTTEFYGVNLAYYTHSTLTTIRTQTEIEWIKALCLSKGATCNNIYITEWNTLPTSSFFNNNNHTFILTNSYVYMLNNYPNNLSSMIFKFNDIYLNSSCSEPEAYSMYKQTNNTYYPPYNVTKSFAHLCPAGSTVYQSSSDDDTIKTVTCKDGNKYNTIIINTDAVSKNVSISQFPNSTTNRLKDYEGSTLYSIQKSTIELGIMDSYEIKYLTSQTCEGRMEDTTCICDSNEILDDDGLTCNSLTEDSNICPALPLGLQQVAIIIPKVLGVVAILLVFTAIGGLVLLIKNPDALDDIDFSTIEAKVIIIGIGSIIMFSVILLLFIETLCAI